MYGPDALKDYEHTTASMKVVENTTSVPEETMTWDDATWILTSAFIIFTMQSGFGLLEAGNVSARNEVNIMVKNVVDVIFGGLTYWMFGFGLSFGEDPGTNAFCSVGYFFVDIETDKMGIVYSTFVFQLSFATTATTIVSGAMAERTKLTAYIIFSLVNTVIYCIPAHWIWGPHGFLRELGAIDFAGSGVVHMVGGVSGLVATLMLKPRLGRFDEGAEKPQMANPANAIVGMFMLWWGWLAFNCGSTFGISNGKWKLAAKCAVTTLLSSMSGGLVGTVLSFIICKGKFDVGYLVNTVLGALVSITAACPLVRPWESVIIGSVGALLTIGVDNLLDKLKIDDPVSAIPVHGACGAWGIIAVGLFANVDRVENLTNGKSGLFHGGGFYMLGVQALTILSEAAWSGILTFLLLYPLQLTIGLRMSEEDEILGADATEHNVVRFGNMSQMTFTSHSEQLITPTKSHIPSIDKGIEEADKTVHNAEWAGRILTLTSLKDLNGRASKRLSQGINGLDREISLPGPSSDVDCSYEMPNRISGMTLCSVQ